MKQIPNKCRMVVFLVFAVVLGQGITGCYTIIRQGEVGVKRTLGKVHPRIRKPNLYVYNPLFTRILKVSTRTVNTEVTLELPSKEGLTIQAQISILYRIVGDSAIAIVTRYDYKRLAAGLVLPVFRSAATDVSSKFIAKDMHTAQRSEIEKAVKGLMNEYLAQRGVIVEAVLMKSIKLPEGLSRSIEEKMQAEQDVQRMEYVLEKERREAERRRIEAEGIRNAQKILQEGLSPLIIQFRSLEVFERLAASPNAKIIVTDGKAPFLIGPEKP